MGPVPGGLGEADELRDEGAAGLLRVRADAIVPTWAWTQWVSAGAITPRKQTSIVPALKPLGMVEICIALWNCLDFWISRSTFVSFFSFIDALL